MFERVLGIDDVEGCAAPNDEPRARDVPRDDFPRPQSAAGCAVGSHHHLLVRVWVEDDVVDQNVRREAANERVRADSPPATHVQDRDGLL